jgi:hypothetical protein
MINRIIAILLISSMLTSCNVTVSMVHSVGSTDTVTDEESLTPDVNTSLSVPAKAL